MRDLLSLRNTIFTYPSKNHPSRHSISSSLFCYYYSSSSSTASEFENLKTLINLNRYQWLPLLDTSQSITQVCQIHAHLITAGHFDSFLARKLLKFYWDFGNVDYTISIFRYIDYPGTFCINTVIKAYSVSSTPQYAVVFYFELLRRGFSPNSHTFPPLIGSCAKMGCVESGRKCHGQAIKNGVNHEPPVQNSLIHMYGSCGSVTLALKVFNQMPIRELVSWNSLVDGYARFGNLDFAHRVFAAMPERNLASWNIIMSGYLKGGIPGCVLKLFRKMVKTGLKGNDITMVNALTACTRSARLKEGRSIHGYLIRSFFKSSIFLDTALINMYWKCHKVDVACRVFESMTEKNLVSWNAMILGHCIHGNPEDGIKLYNKVVRRTRSSDGEAKSTKGLRPDEILDGIFPDEITFIGVLCACARAKLLAEGRDYVHEMVNVFGIKPNFAHYWCIANIFASLGLIQQAEDTIRNMPQDAMFMSPESLVWANLLGLCRFQGDVSLGERIANTLIDMEPQNHAYYQLLLNVYAVAGRWEDAAKVKQMVKEKRVGRMPGCNLVDLKDIVHDLRVEEYWHGGMAESNI